jgi:uncharacterized protein with PIN domain
MKDKLFVLNEKQKRLLNSKGPIKQYIGRSMMKAQAQCPQCGANLEWYRSLKKKALGYRVINGSLEYLECPACRNKKGEHDEYSKIEY